MPENRPRSVIGSHRIDRSKQSPFHIQHTYCGPCIIRLITAIDHIDDTLCIDIDPIRPADMIARPYVKIFMVGPKYL